MTRREAAPRNPTVVRCHRLECHVKPLATKVTRVKWTAALALISLAAVMMGTPSRARAETVLVEVGPPTGPKIFHFENRVTIGGTVQLSFNSGTQAYRLVIRTAERSALDREATGLATPIFELSLYRGGVGPATRIATVEAAYPSEDQNVSCEVHVEPNLPEAFWITFGVGRSGSPRDKCDHMMEITRQLKGK